MLTYPSLVAVLKGFNFPKRRELVAKIPSLRKINKKVPHHFYQVSLELVDDEHVVKIDGLIWRLQCNPINNVPVDREDPVYLEARERIVAETVHKLLPFYLDREGTTVHRMIVKNFRVNSDLMNISSIGFLNMDLEELTTEEECLETFENTKIRQLTLIVSAEETDWIPVLSRMQTKSLILNIFDSTDELNILDYLNFETLQLSQFEFEMDDHFIETCKRFKTKHFRIGSCYEFGPATENDAFWIKLKEQLQVELQDDDWFTTKMLNPEHELFVTRTIELDGSCNFKAEVVDVGYGFALLPSWIVQEVCQNYECAIYFFTSGPFPLVLIKLYFAASYLVITCIFSLFLLCIFLCFTSIIIVFMFSILLAAFLVSCGLFKIFGSRK